jgi:hypothetical protein
MGKLKSIVVKVQKDNGIIVMPDVEVTQESQDGQMNNWAGNSGSYDAKKGGVVVADPKDGYWMVLQTWTQCSLKCGGGVSTMQRMCVPPKNGGKPCEGEAILTKKCNTAACPTVGSDPAQAKTEQAKMGKPIVKVAPFSQRPQRYSVKIYFLIKLN